MNDSRGSEKGLPESIRVLLPDGQVEEMQLEDYLAGVIAAEMGPDAPLEALKAQAVASRTYAAAIHRHALFGADVCTTAHCQEWKHIEAALAPDVYRAVSETRGMVAAAGGRLIQAFFFEHCDGHTRAAEDAMMPPVPYLTSVECPCGFVALKGHGVGMCRRGAIALARQGFAFQEILGHYYRGIRVLDAGGEEVLSLNPLPAVTAEMQPAPPPDKASAVSIESAPSEPAPPPLDTASSAISLPEASGPADTRTKSAEASVEPSAPASVPQPELPAVEANQTETGAPYEIEIMEPEPEAASEVVDETREAPPADRQTPPAEPPQQPPTAEPGPAETSESITTYQVSPEPVSTEPLSEEPAPPEPAMEERVSLPPPDHIPEAPLPGSDASRRTRPRPHLQIDHLPGEPAIAGCLPGSGIQVSIKDEQGNETLVFTGSAPHYGDGGFEMVVEDGGRYFVSVDEETIEVNVRGDTVFIHAGEPKQE